MCKPDLTCTFVIGASGSGKTTLAREIALRDKRPLISAGAWAREWLGEADHSLASASNLAAYSVAILRADPKTTIKYIAGRYAARPAVIEGLRNVADFVHFFDPETDSVIRIDTDPASMSPFDGGVLVIDSYLQWMVSTGLIREDQYEVRQSTAPPLG